MLLMLKRYLKATYSMSEERIAAFSPDLPDKRKQVRSLLLAVGVWLLSSTFQHGCIFQQA